MSRQSRTEVKTAVLIATAFALAGCGGGGLVVQSVPFEGEVTQADYIGKTFPVFFLVGEAGDPSGAAVAGKGTITFNTDDSLTVALPGKSPIVFVRSGTSALGTTYRATSAAGSAIDAVVTGFSSTSAFRLVTSQSDDRSFLGGFGFETLAADRPTGMASYDTAGAVFLTAPNTENFLPLTGTGTLNADFAGGTISGTLLSTDPVAVNLAGVAETPDELALQFMLRNGRITPSGFTGGVTATGELVVDGDGLAGPVGLDVAVGNGGAEGAFFGDEAAAIAGTFEGDLALSDDGTPLVDFEASGFVSGAKETP